jgi:hypothetical protein
MDFTENRLQHNCALLVLNINPEKPTLWLILSEKN